MKGCIYKNGVERQSSQGAFNKEICYIMQDDQLHPIFTVMETMTMAADLKLGRNVSDKVKLILVSIVKFIVSLKHSLSHYNKKFNVMLIIVGTTIVGACNCFTLVANIS